MTIRLLGLGLDQDRLLRSVEPVARGRRLCLYADEDQAQPLSELAPRHLRDVASLAGPAPFLGFRIGCQKAKSDPSAIRSSFLECEFRLADIFDRDAAKAEIILSLQAALVREESKGYLRAKTMASRNFRKASDRLSRDLRLLNMDLPVERVGEPALDEARLTRRDVIRTDRNTARKLAHRLERLADTYREGGQASLAVRGPWPVFTEMFQTENLGEAAA